jgi:hypothetical protein
MYSSATNDIPGTPPKMEKTVLSPSISVLPGTNSVPRTGIEALQAAV